MNNNQNNNQNNQNRNQNNNQNQNNQNRNQNNNQIRTTRTRIRTTTRTSAELCTNRPPADECRRPCVLYFFYPTRLRSVCIFIHSGGSSSSSAWSASANAVSSRGPLQERSATVTM